MEYVKNNIKQYRIEKIKEYLIFSYVISLLMMGLMFKDQLLYTPSHIFTYNIFSLVIFGLATIGIINFLKNIEIISVPSWKDYMQFTILVSGLSFLIYFNKTLHTDFLKIYYFIPVIIATVKYGKKIGFYIAAFSSANSLVVSYLMQNYEQFDTDVLIIILLFWVVWLIGGFIEMERDIQIQLTGLITEEKKLKKELRESQKLFKLNFEESSIGMAICNLDYNYIKINKSLSEILGYDKEELKNINFTDIIHKEERKQAREKYKKILTKKFNTSVDERRYLNKNGEVVWVRENVTLARGDKGQPLYFLIQVEDITEKKQAEKQIKKQKEKLEYNKIRKRFFAKVSHELKTPLNLIFTALHMLPEGDSKNKKYLDIINQNSYRLLKLVNNVIDLTKMDLNDFDLNIVNTDIVKTVREIVSSTREYIVNKKRKLIFNSDLDQEVIACDPFNVERIMLNLISNAVKFTEPGDKIKVNMTKNHDNILISVKDTGIGIKEDKLDIIFDQFRQVNESFTKKAEGSGIGLSIVKSLVDMHGGKVCVESEYGQGSEFLIQLPITKTEEEKVLNNYQINGNLIDEINVEFSDIYK